MQLRVIGALILRDMIARGEAGSFPFLSGLVRPIMMIGGIYIAGRATQLTPAGFPFLVFIVTGYLTWMAFFVSFGVARGGARGSGVLMFPHVTTLDLIIARLGVNAVIFTTVFGTFCLAGMLFEQVPGPADPLGVILAFWSAAALGMTLGLIAACAGRFTTIFEEMWSGVRMIGHALSGVFFVASALPSSVLAYMKWNPLFHSVEWLREAWWPSYKSPIVDPPYIFICIFFMLAIGLAFERTTRFAVGK